MATPTQQDVLKSISDNVGNSVDPGRLLAVVFGMVAVILVIVLVSQRRKREITPRALNHQGKLLKEIARTMNLKPAELRRLKEQAERQQLSSPLLLLLCPSLQKKRKQEPAAGSQ